MSRWEKYLYHASRSRRALWRFALGLVISGVALGALISLLRPSIPEQLAGRIHESSPPEPESPLHLAGGMGMLLFESGATDPEVDFRSIMTAIPVLAPMLDEVDTDRVREILGRRFSASQAGLAVDLILAIGRRDSVAIDRLAACAGAAEPERFARYALGMQKILEGDSDAGLTWLRREGELAEADESRKAVVAELMRSKAYAEFAVLREDPLYRELITPDASLEIAIGQRDWRAILRWVPIMQLKGCTPGAVFLAAVAGLAWAFFLFHLGEGLRFLSATTAFWAIAFIAGVLSTTVTVYAVILQEDILGFTPGAGDFTQALIYYIGGVGVREEAAKLLLFVPLLPFLRRRDDELEVFIAASFVGLGFAFEENGNYFAGSGGLDAPGRFLTANFLHIVLTGLNGLALHRATTRGFHGVNEFLAVFGVTILAHGLYDALPDIPNEVGGYLSLVVFVGVSMFYFSRAHELRENRRMVISLSGAFVAGASLLAATVITYQMAAFGARAGLLLVFPELIGTGILLLMFFREFNEPLSS